MKWIDYLAFLKSFNSIFGTGFTFTKADILIEISRNIELKNMISRMFNGKSVNDEKVDALIGELLKEGFIEVEHEIEGRYKVLNSFSNIFFASSNVIISCFLLYSSISLSRKTS